MDFSIFSTKVCEKRQSDDLSCGQTFLSDPGCLTLHVFRTSCNSGVKQTSQQSQKMSVFKVAIGESRVP